MSGAYSSACVRVVDAELRLLAISSVTRPARTAPAVTGKTVSPTVRALTGSVGCRSRRGRSTACSCRIASGHELRQQLGQDRVARRPGFGTSSRHARSVEVDATQIGNVRQIAPAETRGVPVSRSVRGKREATFGPRLTSTRSLSRWAMSSILSTMRRGVAVTCTRPWTMRCSRGARQSCSTSPATASTTCGAVPRPGSRRPTAFGDVVTGSGADASGEAYGPAWMIALALSSVPQFGDWP